MATQPEVGHKIPDPSRLQHEVYGLSLDAMRRAGEIAVQASQSDEQLAHHNAIKQLRAEFDASLFEGLSSDQEFGQGLRVTKFDSLPVIDGRVMSANEETSIVELVKNGWECSTAAAHKDKRMWIQATRDRNDYFNAVEVDAMVRGERDYNTRIVISADPAEAMRRDGKDYWRKVGYIEGVVYIQVYHMGEGDELYHGSLSFREADKDRLRDNLSKFGIQIPQGEHDGNYINYPLTDTMTAEEAKKLSIGLRNICDKPSETVRADTVEVLDQNKTSVDSIFEEMYLDVAVSLAKGTKTDITKQIVESYLANSAYFSNEVYDRLEKLAATDIFKDADARLLHQLVVYSAIEKMRMSLSKPADMGSLLVETGYTVSGSANIMQDMALLAALGAQFGRSYSSCGAALEIAMNEAGLLQQAYGGKACAREVKDGEHVKCPGCKNVVVAIVHDRGKIECSNKDCDLAAEEVKRKTVTDD